MRKVRSRHFLPFLFLCLSGLSCNRQPISNHPILRVSLEEKEISIADFFQKIEIIPLATSDESLFSEIDKLIVHDSTIFLFDLRQNTLYRFDTQGHFLDKIHRVGRGPQEYLMAYDFVLNPEQETVHLLNPMGWIHEYDYNGTFVERHRLPKPPTSYIHFEILDPDHLVIWSREHEKGMGGINIVDRENLTVLRDDFPYSGLWGALSYGPNFYAYRDGIYYHESLAGPVYQITADGDRTAYEWDLGVQLVDPRSLRPSMDVVNEAQMKLLDNYRQGTIPFFFGKQFQTDRYYYATLVFSGRVLKSLYYDKTMGNGGLFHQTTEEIVLDIRYMTEEHAYGVMTYEDREVYRELVSPAAAALLDTMQDDDNVWLVRFTFND